MRERLADNSRVMETYAEHMYAIRRAAISSARRPRARIIYHAFMVSMGHGSMSGLTACAVHAMRALVAAGLDGMVITISVWL